MTNNERSLTAASIVRYDGTFAGLLTVCYQAYRAGALPRDVQRIGAEQPSLFEGVVTIRTCPERAARVRRGLVRDAGLLVPSLLHRALLSRAPGVESLLLRYLAECFGVLPGGEVAETTAEEAAWLVEDIERLARRVGREVHRMHAFVRFAEGPDGVYVARVEPAYDVLPLLDDHFAARFPAMPWLIHDLVRGQALVHPPGRRSEIVRLPAAATAAEGDDGLMQTLWRTYFRAATIPERHNPTLQQRHLPLHYRKHLPELRPPVDG